MTRFDVTAKRWERGWELHIADVGVTQSHSLRDAERMVRDFIELDLGAEVASTAVIVMDIEVGGLEEDVRAVREELERLDAAQREAAKASRAVAKQLKEAGLTGADGARVMGVSEQRFSQLLNA